MSVIIKKIHGRGGSGRGQGRHPIENKREKVSVSFPPGMKKKIIALKEVTGDSMSATIVWLCDQAIAMQKTKKN